MASASGEQSPTSKPCASPLPITFGNAFKKRLKRFSTSSSCLSSFNVIIVFNNFTFPEVNQSHLDPSRAPLIVGVDPNLVVAGSGWSTLTAAMAAAALEEAAGSNLLIIDICLGGSAEKRFVTTDR